MFTLKVAGRELGPYQAIVRPNGDTEWNILPILYDTAEIHLFDDLASFSLCYKESLNLSGRKMAFVDVVNMADGTFFSLQVSNIFYFGVFSGKPHIIAKVGNELKYFENFWKNIQPIESDGDKHDLTPLGAFDMFLSYDDDYYYPLIFSDFHKKLAKITRFYDYYGYISYTDTNGGKHFVMFIETENSTEEHPEWIFVDNFVPISKNIEIPDYVETWKLDPYGNIIFETTNGDKYHIDRDSGEMIRGWDNLPTSKNFSFVRVFDDTDAEEIVAKNENWYFIISRNKTQISESEQKQIIYFQDFIWCLSPAEANREYPCFLMQKTDGQIVLVDHTSKILAGTELSPSDYEKFRTVTMDTDTLIVEYNNGKIEEYILNV